MFSIICSHHFPAIHWDDEGTHWGSVGRIPQTHYVGQTTYIRWDRFGAIRVPANGEALHGVDNNENIEHFGRFGDASAVLESGTFAIDSISELNEYRWPVCLRFQIPEYCRNLDEKDISDNAFNLIFAFDEIVALGYRESVNLAQIKTFVEMDSHEEKVYLAVRQTQEREAKQKMREKAKELQRQRLESSKRGGSSLGRSGYGGGSSVSSGGFGSSSGMSTVLTPSSVGISESSASPKYDFHLFVASLQFIFKTKLSFGWTGNQRQLVMHSNWVARQKMSIPSLINWRTKVKKLPTWLQLQPVKRHL